MEEPARITKGDFAVVSHGGVIELFMEKITGRRQKPRYCEGISLIRENESRIQLEENV